MEARSQTTRLSVLIDNVSQILRFRFIWMIMRTRARNRELGPVSDGKVTQSRLVAGRPTTIQYTYSIIKK